MTLRSGEYPPLSKWAQGNHTILKTGETLLTMVRDRCDWEEWSESGNIVGFEDRNKGYDFKNTSDFLKLEKSGKWIPPLSP